MRTFTVLVAVTLSLLTGCKSAPQQRVSVGLRVHVSDPLASNRHRAAKIPLDLMIEYEVSGQPAQPEPNSDQ